MGNVYNYLWAVFVKWWWLVTVILFGIDKALEWMWPRYRTWLNETFPEATRRKFFWRILFVFVFFSGYLAWREEHIALEQTRRDLAKAESAAPGKLDPEPATLGKYVCTITLPVTQGTYALLVEFGVRHGQTDGFYGSVEFTTPYVKKESWMGVPLRTDKQQEPSRIDYGTHESPSHLRYEEKFASPVITPHRSSYFYFEAEKPLQIANILFIEDAMALSDQIRADTLSRQFDPCPR
jgi:hypothetical protein